MAQYLGIDTSNYTTSAAVYGEGAVKQSKMLLPVKKNEKGIRQSDAVFHHTGQLPQVISKVVDSRTKITAVGVSEKPRNESGSYMPCFTVGLSSAKIISNVLSVPLYCFSHQQGHIAAALYGADKLDLIDEQFIAFHISGGTTEALLVSPSDENIINTQIIAGTLDLNAGQAVDRVGVMLGLQFPCGKQLEQLALNCNENIRIKPTLKGSNCCLSGVENICKRFFDEGRPSEYIALYVLRYIQNTVAEMTRRLVAEYGGLKIVYAGGVMSNSIIKASLQKEFDCFFAPAEFSCDNAVGAAVLASIKHKRQC